MRSTPVRFGLHKRPYRFESNIPMEGPVGASNATTSKLDHRKKNPSRLFAALCLPLVLIGCAMTPTAAPTPEPSVSPSASITGVVHGGQQPIVGAEIFLFAANTTGYGGNGLAASTSNASISLLQPAANTSQDTTSTDPTYLDYYTTTGTGGTFSISGDYTCTPRSQVYIYALGGNPTYPSGSANSAIGLLAALGPCPSADSFPSTTYVVVNEVSTIATAYAFAGFATDALHVSSSGTTLAQTGISNAFANVTNLEALSAGTALATTPAGNGVSNGTVPQSTINTLADILAACVNTPSPTSSGCSTLFANAMSGGSTGTTATDTATAAINIAHNPGTSIAALYALATANPPFAPTLTARPLDFTLGLNFAGGGLSDPISIAIDGSGDAWIANAGPGAGVTEFSSAGAALSPSTGYTGGGLDYAQYIAIDGSGDAWITNYNNNNISKFSNTGVALSPSTGYTGGGLDGPGYVAIDSSGDAWTANAVANSVSEFSSEGTALSSSTGYTGGGLSYPISIAIDGSGDAWTANNVNASVSKFSSAGIALSPSTGYTAGGLSGPSTIAIDASGDAWVADYENGSNSVSKLSSAGVALSPSTGYTGGGLNDPYSVAIDGSGNAWIANHNNPAGVSEFSNAGIALSPSTGYAGGGLKYPYAIAIDGSGDVWVSNIVSGSNETVIELIGLATPVITPICAGLPATPTANGTSNLGTRP
jgi:hypothetical protein